MDGYRDGVMSPASGLVQRSTVSQFVLAEPCCVRGAFDRRCSPTRSALMSQVVAWSSVRWFRSTRLSRMPAGLDGHPRPIRTFDRDAVLGAVADRVCSVDRRRVLVGIDGRSGSGKSTFADELAAHLGQRGRVVIRSTTDSFHRPREERLARGRPRPTVTTSIHTISIASRTSY